MGELGKLLTGVGPVRAAVGFVVLVVTSAFSLGVATTSWVGMPRERFDSLEVQLDTVSRQLVRHIQQDSVATGQVFCLLRVLLEPGNERLNPVDCDPNLRR